MNTQLLADLLTSQVRFESMTTPAEVDNLYDNLTDDLNRMFPNWNITFDKSKAGEAFSVKRGKYFQYFALPNLEVLVTNKFF